MHPSFVPPRRVKIGDAAAFAGTTPRAIRHYHEIGLLPEPERGGDDRRRYGYEDMVRLLWVRRMADTGIALDDIRDAFAGSAPGSSAPAGSVPRNSDDDDIAAVLERLDEALVAQEAELRRQRAAVQRMRTQGSRAGLLSDVVTERLANVPEGSLRQADLDTLLVTERIFGPLGAAIQATRFIALAGSPDLRAESDRVDAAEEALDDTVAVDDPRVSQVAAERHAFEQKLEAAMEEAGLDEGDEALLDSWDAGEISDTGQTSMSVLEAVGKMPYDFSPARLRCMELAVELGARG
ncbi:MerR family transcriptional regulator [Promicromonospora sukumoe]|uniref:DNA-binding transcriptional MerR regulator n=1 Tax=Promicromonospora sukumoe TaxID=88382 RepID=A0A7W3JEJ4_9MICO|nr:MerR family transcriptional regulator [Promicromonospora sukumoe]MBA8811389.1 DNA-binding transcriptional MerR regulator [Promicromonospora sukumoe]